MKIRLLSYFGNVPLVNDAEAEDAFSGSTNVIPATTGVNVGKTFRKEFPANSLTVIRMKTR